MLPQDGGLRVATPEQDSISFYASSSRSTITRLTSSTRIASSTAPGRNTTRMLCDWPYSKFWLWLSLLSYDMPLFSTFKRSGGMTRTGRIASAIVFCAGVLTISTPVHTAVTVVMSGLDNPRGLAFGPEGALYVVEAGRGGSGPCQVLRGLLRCYGPPPL